MAEDLDRVALPDRIRKAIGDAGAGDRVSLHISGPCPEVLAEPARLDARLRELLRGALERRRRDGDGERHRATNPVTIEVRPRAREVEVTIDGERFTLPVALLSGSGRP